MLASSCSENPEGKVWHHADFIIVDRKGFEHRMARVEDPAILRKLHRMAVSNRPAYLCPVDRIIRLVSTEGRVLSLPLSLCSGNEHIYTKYDRTWSAWRIDPRLLPLLDSLFSSTPQK
jgi:hypothetical protein